MSYRIISWSLTMLAVVVLTIPAVAAGAIPELQLDTARFRVMTPWHQESPAIAGDGTGYLAAWVHRETDRYQVVACRLAATGVPRDTSGILLRSSAQRMQTPAVAWDGTNYLVVWIDARNDTLTSRTDVYATRVSAGGSVLDPAGIALCTAADDQYDPAVTFAGGNYLVVWQDHRNYATSRADIYGTRVSPAGSVLDPSGIALCTATGSQLRPDVTRGGADCLVVWDDERTSADNDIYGTRVDSTGSVLDPTGIALSTAARSQEYPAVAFDGTNWSVAWQDDRNLNQDIYATRVSPTGSVLDPSGVPVSTATGNQMYPAAAFDDTSFLFAWTDYRNGGYGDVYAARLSPAGTLLDPTGRAVTTADDNQVEVRLAPGGADAMLVWTDERNGYYRDIYGARMKPSGQVLDPGGLALSVSLIPDSAVVQLNPAVATGGTDFLAIWQDNRAGTFGIYGERVSVYGDRRDRTPIRVSPQNGNNHGWPALASEGANGFLAAWADDADGHGDIYAARISLLGAVRDPQGIRITNQLYAQTRPAIAYGAGCYLVAWSDHRTNPGVIYAARVTTAGILLDSSGFLVRDGIGDLDYPSVAFDGTNFLVAWADVSHGVTEAARVSPAGVVLDPSGIGLGPVGTAPSAAFDGTNFLVAWHLAYADSSEICGTRVSPAGVRLDPATIPIAVLPDSQVSPAVAFDETCYVVVYADHHNGQLTPDIHNRLVTKAGTILDSGVISGRAGAQEEPAIACNLASLLLVAYQGYSSTVHGRPVGRRRIWGRFFNRAPDIAVGPILSPLGILDSGDIVTPSCSISNHGGRTADFQLRLKIGGSYNRANNIGRMVPGTSELNQFSSWNVGEVGTIAVSCSAEYAPDIRLANNKATASVEVRNTHWLRRPEIPLGPRRKGVKDGGCMAFAPGEPSLLYALKGAGVREFYRYDPAGNTWQTMESIPGIGASGRKKAVKKGATLAAATGNLYAAKGGSTLEWWRYAPGTAVTGGTWTQLADIPLGMKGMREGTGTASKVVGETACIYLLKGSNTQEFYRYDITDNVWQSRASAPLGISGRAFKNGSALCAGPDGTVFALKAGYNEFYAYDAATDAWTTRANLPLVGASGRKKKVGAGGGIAYLNGLVFTLKGNNTSEWWSYLVSTDTWVQLTDVPAGVGRRVKGGACVVPFTDRLYVLKGNGTQDFYQYVPTTGFGTGTAAQAGATTRLTVTAGPLLTATTISYSLPRAGRVRLTLHDAAGRRARLLNQGLAPAGESKVLLSRTGLSRGVYLLRLETEAGTLTRKLIIE